MVKQQLLDDYSSACDTLVAANIKVRMLRRSQEHGSTGNRLTRVAFNATVQLNDAYHAVSVARGEVTRLQRQIEKQLFNDFMYGGL